jgi:hypothetical protein
VAHALRQVAGCVACAPANAGNGHDGPPLTVHVPGGACLGGGVSQTRVLRRTPPGETFGGIPASKRAPLKGDASGNSHSRIGLDNIGGLHQATERRAELPSRGFREAAGLFFPRRGLRFVGHCHTP